MKWGIGNIKGGSGGASKTMLTTTTDATENSGTYTLALSNLSETPKVNDYVVYVNSGAITTLYKVSAIGSTDATLEKIGDIGGGKQLYQHNVNVKVINNNKEHIIFSLISDSNVQMDFSALLTWLTTNGFTNGNLFNVNGRIIPYGDALSVIGMYYVDSTHIRVVGWNANSDESANSYTSFYSITDTVISL